MTIQKPQYYVPLAGLRLALGRNDDGDWFVKHDSGEVFILPGLDDRPILELASMSRPLLVFVPSDDPSFRISYAPNA